jgi:hypothetical protein
MESAISAPGRSRRLGRSIAAIFAGFLVIAVLDNLIDFILHSTGVYPPFGQTMTDGLFLVAVAYRTVDGILGCYIAASLAPNRPMRHALILGSIGVILSSLGALATIGAGPEFGPIWYPFALVGIALPCAWVGGKLVETRRRATPQAALA